VVIAAAHHTIDTYFIDHLKRKEKKKI
jgi:hypothetical protein